MHILVSNHAAEIAAFRAALGSAGQQLEVAENNLSALSVIGNRADEVDSLVITEHQDQAVNLETDVFVQNMVSRLLDSSEVIVVGALNTQALGVQIVDTIDQAAAIVRSRHDLVPTPMIETPSVSSSVLPPMPSNGHAPVERPTLGSPPAQGEQRPSPPIERPQPAVERQPIQAAPPVPTVPVQHDDRGRISEEIPHTTRSLADDIRDWTEQTEQQRGQGRPTRNKSLMERLSAMLPANRRLIEEEARYDAAIRQPRLTRCNSIAVISPKGGVGKSFLTYLVGNFLAEVRGDKVIAIDTNPDFGTLADQVRGREEQTVSTLLQEINRIQHYSDMRRFTSKVDSRLEVLAAPADPDEMASIAAQDYALVYEQLHHYYDTVIFDCGTGFRDDITRFALKQSDQIVLVSAPLFITTGIVIRALGYLDQIGCDLKRVTLAINQVRRERPLDLEYMRSRFGNRLNAIIEIPFDLQLYHAMDRGEFTVDDTQQATRNSVKHLVSELVRHFE